MQPAMRRLALFRVALGAFAWIAPGTMNRVFGVPSSDESPALICMNRVFGVRAIALGAGYLASSGSAHELWHRLWLLCDSADTVMGAMAIELAAMREGKAVGSGRYRET